MLSRSFIVSSVLSFVLAVSPASSQNGAMVNGKPYQEIAQRIVTRALSDGHAYELLSQLTAIGPRLSGSSHADEAVEWGRQTMEQLGFDNVWLQSVLVPHWVRGPVEQAAIINSPSQGNVPLSICALGGSIATVDTGVIADVIEVKTFEELRSLGQMAAGKIIFFNRPMDPTYFDTFTAYSKAVDQRSQGAIEAAKVGGVAALVRSMTTSPDDVPHTGTVRYDEKVPKIPAAALSTMAANFLSQLLAAEKKVTVRLKLTCETLPDVPSANVMGELMGASQPDEIILVGGHLDSWDKGTGAHDDGAGCVQAIEAVRLLKELGLKPARTIRAVLFMNEENGLRGGEAYGKEAAEKGIRHVAAIESDRGGFAPRGFSMQADSILVERVAQWKIVFAPIGADRIRRGFGGVDILPLARQGVPALSLVPDPHRYFDYHHSDNDTLDKVNPRELGLGAAAMAIMAYVLSEEL